MLAAVSDEVGALAEGFAAYLAFVGLLPCGAEKMVRNESREVEMPFSRCRPDWLRCLYSLGQNDFPVPLDTHLGPNISVSGEYIMCINVMGSKLHLLIENVFFLTGVDVSVFLHIRLLVEALAAVLAGVGPCV